VIIVIIVIAMVTMVIVVIVVVVTVIVVVVTVIVVIVVIVTVRIGSFLGDRLYWITSRVMQVMLVTLKFRWYVLSIHCKPRNSSRINREGRVVTRSDVQLEA